MAYVVLARWVAKPGEEEAVAAAIDALIAPSRAEPGNLMYEAHRDPSDPRVFLLYEQYADEDGYRAHGESEHFTRLGHGDAIPRLESRERSFYETW
ncbi:MAG TPA: putative quinol monooxygenase [Solirubrobacteraceae bacterium]|jgi:quinol monooxygenase YgiN|nr:putative quinol monooxygenase [Solirubrobacteraceae bacterium]